MTTYEKLIGLILIFGYIILALQYAKDKKIEKQIKLSERLKRVENGEEILKSIPETELN